MSVTIDALREHLDRMTPAEVLEDRKRKEIEFHDRDHTRTGQRLHKSDHYFTAGLSMRHMADWITRESPGRAFLDFCCGNGSNSRRAAGAGAALAIGIDISPVSVANAQESAREDGLSERCRYVVADAEHTGLPDGSIDRIVCCGVLHHLDLSYALPELRRILAPGGKIFAFEALNYNPAISLYRRLTPNMRTEWERDHILSLKDLRFAGRFFTVADVRYWHVVSPIGALAPSLMPILDSVDGVLTKIPAVQLMSWIFTFELRHRKDS